MDSIKKIFSGVIIPMITPVTNDGNIDVNSAFKIIDRFVKAGVYPFILGTTGEGTSVFHNDKSKYVEMVCNEFGDSTTVYVGIASNVLEDSIQSANKFAEYGVDAVVANLPSYYALTHDQMYLYFKKLADSIDVPLLIYNIKATTHMSIPLEIVEKLSTHKNIVGLKDSERDEQRLKKAIAMFGDREDFVHHIGWAAQSVNGLSLGSDGLVPSTGNFVPGMFKELYDHVQNKDVDKAIQLQAETDSIAQIYQTGKGLGHSLASLKVMMNHLDLCETTMLPPLTKLEGKEEMEIRNKVDEIKNPIR